MMGPDQVAAFARLFELAQGHGGGSEAARSFLCAWWASSRLGKLDPRDLWRLDRDNLDAARVAMSWFLERNGLEGSPFDRDMRALAARVEEGGPRRVPVYRVKLSCVDRHGLPASRCEYVGAHEPRAAEARAVERVEAAGLTYQTTSSVEAGYWTAAESA